MQISEINREVVVGVAVGNSVCRVTGLSSLQFQQLRKILSYRVDAQVSYFAQDHRGGVRHLLSKRGDFPTGLLYLVEDYLRTARLFYVTKDYRTLPAPLGASLAPSLGSPPYSWQIEAAAACRKSGRGIVTAPTGTGKSVAAALIVGELCVRTLIVVPSLELKRQVTATLSAMYPPGTVGGIGSVIGVENVAALSPEVDIKKKYGYDCVLIDEFHHSGAATYRALNRKAWAGVYYKIGLTATPFRSQENERLLLESVLSQVVYRLDYHTAVARGYIVPIEAYYYELPCVPVGGYTWSEVYKELVVSREDRNGLICALVKALCFAGTPVLCLVKEIAHGEKISAETALPLVKGENTDNRQRILEFNLCETPGLIATTGVMGEGVDTKPCEYVVIAGLGKSKNQFMQQCGRGVRKYPGKESCKVIIFYDRSHKWTSAHFKAQVKVLREEYGVEPVKLEFG